MRDIKVNISSTWITTSTSFILLTFISNRISIYNIYGNKKPCNIRSISYHNINQARIQIFKSALQARVKCQWATEETSDYYMLQIDQEFSLAKHPIHKVPLSSRHKPNLLWQKVSYPIFDIASIDTSKGNLLLCHICISVYAWMLYMSMEILSFSHPKNCVKNHE